MAVLGLPGLQDRKAVRDWMDGHTSDSAELYQSLPSLPVGDAWIWTPQEQRLARDHFPTITTLDTSSTPAAGQRRAVRSALSADDIAKLTLLLAEIAGATPGIPRVRRERVRTSAGAAIVRLRERLKLTQDELARMIGSEQKSISRMESGRTFVSTRALEKIATATDSELRVEFVPKTK